MTYSSTSIRTMDPLTHIRTFPARYLGDYDTHAGITHLIKELVDNAIDEALMDPLHQHPIEIAINIKKDVMQVVVQDHARGIPLDKVTAVFSKPRTSGKWGKAYSATSGVHGEGAKAIAAISKLFIGMSERENGVSDILIQNGGIIGQHLQKHKKHTSGTAVFFETDPKFITCVSSYSMDYLASLLEFLTVFIPNVKFELRLTDQCITDAILQGTSFQRLHLLRSFGSTGKIYTFQHIDKWEYLSKKLHCPQQHHWEYHDSQFDVPGKVQSYEFHLKYHNDWNESHFIGSVNFVPIHGLPNYHIQGLMACIKEQLVGFIDNQSVVEFFMNQYKLPLFGYIEVRTLQPKFIDQTKTGFKDKEFLKQYRELLLDKFKHASKKMWEDLFECINDHLHTAYQAYITQSFRINKGLRNILWDLKNPACFLSCDTNHNESKELFITEGVSAGGNAGSVRNPVNQAVFQLKGKPINAIKRNSSQLLDDAIVQDLIMVLGVTPGSDSLEHLNFDKIILLTDADSDGKHIAALLIGLMSTLCPSVINEGKVFISNPPLYSLELGNTRKYLKDEIAYMDTKIELLYSEVLQIRLINQYTKATKILQGDEYRAFMYTIDHIGNAFNHLETNVSINAEYLEMLCHVLKYLDNPEQHLSTITKILHADKIDYQVNPPSLIVTNGAFDINIPLHNLAAQLRQNIMPLLNAVHWKDIIIEINYLNSTTPPTYVTIVQLFKIVQQLNKLLKVRRYKGLGEMKPMELYTTCIDPVTRSCQVVTSIGDIERIYSVLGVDASYRKILLQSQ